MSLSYASSIRRTVALIRQRGGQWLPGGHLVGYASRATLDLLVEEIGRDGARMEPQDGPLPAGVYCMFEGVEFSLSRVAFGHYIIMDAAGHEYHGGGPVYDES